MNKPNWIINSTNITVNYDGQTHIVPRNTELGKSLYQAIKEENYEKIPEIVSIAKSVKEYSDGKFTIVDGELLIGQNKVPSQLAKKILQFKDEGLPYQPLVNFAEKLLQNPSYRAVNELFQFLEKNDHPITEGGNFLAFKRVRSDFKDIYTGTFDNSPGQVVSMPRNQVNEDQNQTCSNGLHISAIDYCHHHYGSNNASTDIFVEVEVNPKDVVSVPIDYSFQKMRVCEYLVLGVIDPEVSKEIKERIRYSPETPTDDWAGEESSEESEWVDSWTDESSDSWEEEESSDEPDIQKNTTGNHDPYYEELKRILKLRSFE